LERLCLSPFGIAVNIIGLKLQIGALFDITAFFEGVLDNKIRASVGYVFQLGYGGNFSYDSSIEDEDKRSSFGGYFGVTKNGVKPFAVTQQAEFRIDFGIMPKIHVTVGGGFGTIHKLFSVGLGVKTFFQVKGTYNLFNPFKGLPTSNKSDNYPNHFGDCRPYHWVEYAFDFVIQLVLDASLLSKSITKIVAENRNPLLDGCLFPDYTKKSPYLPGAEYPPDSPFNPSSPSYIPASASPNYGLTDSPDAPRSPTFTGLIGDGNDGNSSSAEAGGMSPGAIVGLTIGVVAAVLIIAAIIIAYVSYKVHASHVMEVP